MLFPFYLKKSTQLSNIRFSNVEGNCLVYILSLSMIRLPFPLIPACPTCSSSWVYPRPSEGPSSHRSDSCHPAKSRISLLCNSQDEKLFQNAILSLYGSIFPQTVMITILNISSTMIRISSCFSVNSHIIYFTT